MSISILTVDQQLIIQTWDSHLTQMTGISSEQACGRSLREFIPHFKSVEINKPLTKVLQEGSIEVLTPQKYSYLIPCPPQTPSKHFEYMQQRVTIAPLKEKSAIIGAIITIEDVTPKLDTEEDIEATLKTPTASGEENLSKNLEEQDFNRQSMQKLLRGIESQDWQIRSQAVEELRRTTNPQITQELIQLLREHHRNPSILNSVLSTLHSTRLDPLDALIECLSDPDTDLRIYVALVLGERKDPRAIPALLKSLNDPDTNVRYHTIESLARLQATEAIEPLIKIAESEDFYLAFAALDALLQIGDSAITPRIIPLLQHTINWRVRREAVDTLALDTDSELMGELVQLLRKHHRNPNILNSILQVFALSHLDPLPLLIKCLYDQDTDLRIYTALALGERQDSKAIPHLLKALDDPDTNVRYHIIESLGRLRATEAIEPLLEIAESGDFFLAFPAIDALISIGISESGRERVVATIAPQLVPLLDNDLICPIVVEALGQLGDAMVVAPMAKLINQENAPIFEIASAIYAIYQRYQNLTNEGSYITDIVRTSIAKEGVKQLIQEIEQINKLPQSSDIEKSLSALVFLLGCLDGREVEESLSQLLAKSQVRNAVIEALVSHGSRVNDLLIAQLDADDIPTRKAAITALGRIGSPSAVPALINLLRGDLDLVMPTTAALAQIGDIGAFEALLHLLGHPDAMVRLGAIAALNSLGHPQMPERILSLLDDSDVNVRESAIKIAGYFAFPQVKETFFEKLNDPDEKIRRAVLEHLPYWEDERVLPALLNALKNEIPSVRATAAHALGALEDLHAFPHLLKALEDPEPWVRYQVARALGRYHYLLKDSRPSSHKNYLADAFEGLRDLIHSDPEKPVRAAATEAIGLLAQEKAIPILALLMEQEQPNCSDIARSAIMTLGQIHHASAVGPLLNALNSPNAERRLDAIQAWRERGGGEAEVALQWMAAADPDPAVARAALESLSQMSTPEAIASILELTIDPTSREACIKTLVNQGINLKVAKIEYIEAIAKSLNHPHLAVRCAVIDVLKRLKHPHASEHLIAALNDQDASVRLAAVNALIYLGNRACDDQLRVLARSDPNPALRRAAQKYLIQH